MHYIDILVLGFMSKTGIGMHCMLVKYIMVQQRATILRRRGANILKKVSLVGQIWPDKTFCSHIAGKLHFSRETFFVYFLIIHMTVYASLVLCFTFFILIYDVLFIHDSFIRRYQIQSEERSISTKWQTSLQIGFNGRHRTTYACIEVRSLARHWSSSAGWIFRFQDTITLLNSTRPICIGS